MSAPPPSLPAIEPQPGLLSRPLLLTTIGSFALIFLAAFEALAVATIMPVVTRDLGGENLYAIALAAPLATGIIGMVGAGGWADRRGPAGPFWWGCGLFAAGLIVCGLAQDMTVFTGGRILQGLGAGAINVTIYVLVARLYPPLLHPKIFGLFAAAWVLPSLVGPFIAGAVAEALSWHWVFLGVVALVAIGAALMAPSLRGLALRSPAAPAKQMPDAASVQSSETAAGSAGETATAPAGGLAPELVPELTPVSGLEQELESVADGAEVLAEAALEPAVAAPHRNLARDLARATGVAGAVLALGILGQIAGWGPLIVVALAVAVFLLIRPLLPEGTFKLRRGLPAAIALRAIVAGAYFGAEAYLLLLMNRIYGLSVTYSGLALTAAAVTWALASWVQGRFLAKRPDRWLLTGALSVVVLSLGGLAVTTALHAPVWVLIVFWGIGGFGMGLAYPRLSTMVIRLSPPDRQGFNSAALNMADSTGASLCLAALGLLQRGDEFGPLLFILSLAAGLSLVGALVARRTGPSPRSSTPVPLEAGTGPAQV